MRLAVLVAVFVLGVLGSTGRPAAASGESLPAVANSLRCGDVLCADGGLFDEQSGTCIACGQPLSDGFGGKPVTSDALAVLRAAVGLNIEACSGERFCLCDVDCSGTITTADALRVLRAAVGQSVELQCCCAGSGGCLPCTSAEIFTRAGSDLDIGWTGISHDSNVPQGDSITVRVKRECSATSSQECERDEDCPNGETCEPTCDCNDDVTCELTGPTHERKCQNDLESCSTNADCDPSIPCVHLLGPPIPLSSGGTPVCVVNVFADPITGTANSETGEAEIETTVRARVAFGIQLDLPCPQCGAPDQDPEVGDTFQCIGGQKPGATCTVEGVSAEFGGTSTDCPPNFSSAILGSGLVIPIRQATTGTTSRTAQVPCKAIGTTANPLNPGTNPKCTDKIGTGDPVCTSNADCRRCTEDITISCTNDDDCSGNGSCAEAPDQPVTCGYWCHCGFCNQNASLPCFETSDCPDGQTCQAGTGASNTPTMGQQRPNDCGQDNFQCGTGSVPEQCATTLKSSCSEASYRTCDTNQDCENFNAGFCNFEPRPCFESRIIRTGAPSPPGSYCAFESKTCTTNADCTQVHDFCAQDSSRAETVALLCLPATSSPPINNAHGITGPAAVRLNSFTQICRCGDGNIGCDEQCDDSNTANGDGCDDLCQEEEENP